MNLNTLASYAVGFAGVGMMGLAIAPMLGGQLSYPESRRLLTNMFRTDPARAEVLCKTMSGTFYEALASAIKTAAQVGSTDPAMVVAGTKPGYDAIATVVSQKWKGVFGKGKLAAMATAGAFFLAVSANTSLIPFVLAALLVGAGLGWIAYQRAEIERTLVLARAEILPEVERMFIEGRYRPPAR